MTVEQKLEEKIQNMQRKINAVNIRMEKFEQDYQAFLHAVDMTPDQLHSFATTPSNFTAEVWEELQKSKKFLDERLALQLSNVRDERKVKKTFFERGKVQQHWLFVR